eukprot:scaffold35661_cov67-Cyclotella_meneghiniana.AAC.3
MKSPFVRSFATAFLAESTEHFGFGPLHGPIYPNLTQIIMSAAQLSSYEENRARNIERNNARLRSLGLISAKEEKRSNDSAWGRNIIKSQHHDNNDESKSLEDDEYTDEKGSVGKRKRITKPKSAPREGSRKSRRIMSLPAEHSNVELNGESDGDGEREERIDEERKAIIVECREARQRAAIEVAKAGVKAGKENPTATYEHCLMRVRTMSEKGLANRIRAIERAAGKHCVVKMAIFKSCLQDENMWELAQEAAEALERLKGMLPPPTE